MSGKHKNKKNKKDKKEKGQESVENELDIDLPTYEEMDSKVPDFEELAQYKGTTGGHFMFSSEKKWSDNDETTTNSKLFQLDTDLINASILSIPFCDRHLFDIEFTEEEKIKMLENARTNEKKYWELVETKNAANKKTPIKATIEKSKQQKLPINLESSSPKKTESKETASPSKSPSATVQSPDKSKESIQKWLDDILDL